MIWLEQALIFLLGIAVGHAGDVIANRPLQLAVTRSYRRTAPAIALAGDKIL